MNVSTRCTRRYLYKSTCLGFLPHIQPLMRNLVQMFVLHKTILLKFKSNST